jgi:hypothetical protein
MVTIIMTVFLCITCLKPKGDPIHMCIYIYIVGRGPMHVKDTLRVLVLVALFGTDCCSNMTGVFLLFEPYCSQQCVLFGFLV